MHAKLTMAKNVSYHTSGVVAGAMKIEVFDMVNNLETLITDTTIKVARGNSSKVSLNLLTTAIRMISPGTISQIEVLTDENYLMTAICSIRKWKRNDFIGSNGEELKNVKAIKRFLKYYDSHYVMLKEKDGENDRVPLPIICTSLKAAREDKTLTKLDDKNIKELKLVARTFAKEVYTSKVSIEKTSGEFKFNKVETA